MKERFAALSGSGLVACAFQPENGRVVWQSRLSRERFGDFVGRDMREKWPDAVLTPGVIDRMGPTAEGELVRVRGWSVGVEGGLVLSVLEGVEALKTSAGGATTGPMRKGGRGVGKPARGGSRAVVALAASRELMRLMLAEPRSLDAQDQEVARLLRLGYATRNICVILNLTLAEVTWSYIRLARQAA